MTKVTRRLGTLLIAAAGLTLVGCGSTGQPSSGEGESNIGQLGLPLVTQGASGVMYRLRDATFNIHHYGYGGYGGSVSGGGSGEVGEVTTVSSESDPDAATISVSLEEGQYFVELLPGWHFEKQTSSGYEAVEATLLSGQTQWVWVSRRSTSFAEFEFGLGGREIWLNGELNIGVVLHEDPSELGGCSGTGGCLSMGGFAGTGGFAGAGGFPSAGGAPGTGGSF
jgi:hypothetical protein